MTKICATCGKSFEPDKRKTLSLRAKYKHCSKECRKAHSVIARLWSKVAVLGKDECWIWRGATGHCGHPHLCVNGGTVYATRIILEQKLGRLLTDGECALHKCDNPPCCNPAHLFAGTRADNNTDRWLKGRYGPQPRDYHGRYTVLR